VGRLLHESPRLARTYSAVRGELYQCADAVVGTRREWDADGQIITIYMRNPHQRSTEAVLRQLRRKTKEARALPYPEVRKLPESLLRIAPRPRCPAIVTNCSEYGIPIGMPALAELEGAGFAVGIASIEGGTLRLSVSADHRVHNGRELGMICQALRGMADACPIADKTGSNQD
jgi:hypothetical protein